MSTRKPKADISDSTRLIDSTESLSSDEETVADRAAPAAVTVKRFITLQDNGILSTVSRSIPGYPFGSVVPYDVDSHGSPIIFISRIAEHYRNLIADPRASLCVVDQYGCGDVQSNARATVVGDFAPVSSSEISASYWARFPDAPERSLAHDFEFWRLTPVKVRWIGGFGDIRWISAENYHLAPFDPVAYSGSSIIRHMNDDHRDALATILRNHFGIKAAAAACQMLAIHSSGFVVSCSGEDGRKQCTIPFPSPVSEPKEIRAAMLAMLHERA